MPGLQRSVVGQLLQLNAIGPKAVSPKACAVLGSPKPSNPFALKLNTPKPLTVYMVPSFISFAWDIHCYGLGGVQYQGARITLVGDAKRMSSQPPHGARPTSPRWIHGLVS